MSVMSSELHNATFRIVCEINYGPSKLGTVTIAQKGMIISYNDKKKTNCINACYYVIYDSTVNINFVCI